LRATKIVATLGPASDGKIEELIGAGVDVFRLNFSYGSHAEHAARIADIRAAAERGDRHVRNARSERPRASGGHGPRLAVFGVCGAETAWSNQPAPSGPLLEKEGSRAGGPGMANSPPVKLNT